MEYIQQQMFLTKDNKLVFRENTECILVFVERELWGPHCCNEFVQMFVKGLGIDVSECDFKRISNDYGYKRAIEMVKYWKRDCSTTNHTLVLITNMTQFLYSGIFNTWSDEQQKFLTYIVDNNGIFHWVHDMTEKELRAGHNLEAIYRNGGFDLDECN